MELYELLKELVETPGISGDEEPIRAKIIEVLGQQGFTDDDIEVDKLGNLKVRVRGRSDRPVLAFMAHMDEIGLVVRHVDEDGYLYVENVGMLDVRTIMGQPIVFYRRPRYEGEPWRDRMYIGVVGVKPVHLLAEEERRRVPDIRELFVDVGLHELLRGLGPEEKRRKIRELGISPGDLGHPVKRLLRMPSFQGQEGDLVVGRSLDDRAGCAALIMALKEMKGMAKRGELPSTVFGVFTTQEEIGARGARVAAYGLWTKSEPRVGSPDVVVVVEVTHASGYPGFGAREYARIELGRGPAISRGPPLHPGLSEKIIGLLRDLIGEEPQVKYESGRRPTDVVEAQVAGTGALAAIVNIPLKYMHTGVEVASLRDIETTAKLLVEIARRAGEFCS